MQAGADGSHRNLEDVGHIRIVHLFHVGQNHDRAEIFGQRGQRLLLAGREPPARWPVALPDLRSRLRATAVAGVRPPEDALLAALLHKHFADRQLRLDPSLAAWLLPRLPREAAAVAEAASRLDRAALACGGRLTRSLAASVLGGPDDDFLVATGDSASTSPRLL